MLLPKGFKPVTRESSEPNMSKRSVFFMYLTNIHDSLEIRYIVDTIDIIDKIEGNKVVVTHDH
jgi:hypothetical protein